jgi:hypothetical protein
MDAPSSDGCDKFSSDDHARARYEAPSADCGPIASEPIGSAVPTQPFTVCCAP